MTSTSLLYDKFLTCTGVSTDTRQITPNCLFVALRGDTFNANEFALQALSAGAAYAVVDDPAVAAADPRCLLVENTLTALQDLARHHRRRFICPVIGLTGSNGKTTTKELIANVLSRRYVTQATVGNLNNHIGVPLTLLRIDPATCQMAVVEMGANHRQEIALLCHLCEPTHGLITNVGKAHLEGFGGLAGVRAGKGELFNYLAETGGTAFVNATDETIMAMQAERQLVNPVFYLTDNQLELLSESPVAVFRTAAGTTVTTHLPGRYNFENIAAALAIGQYFDVPDAEANAAVAGYNPTNNRSQVLVKGTNIILLDAYNANPSSMAAAIRQFGQAIPGDGPAPRRVVILGDMYEMGDDSPAEHAALGELVAEQQFDLVILAGKDMKYALPALPRAYYFPDKFSLHNWIADHPMTHTHVLIKGSRGMGLESVMPFI